MSSTQAHSTQASRTSTSRAVEMKLEVVVIPVTDVERARRFYDRLGWRLDADFAVGGEFRVVQMTPPGSSCSIHFGTGISAAAPGSASGLWLAVSDILQARAELVARDVGVSEIFHRAGPGQPALNGVDPERRSYFSYATFNDPDGNTWLLQEVSARLPGRVDTDIAEFRSTSEFASALRRAATAHGEHEKRMPGEPYDSWPEWYAEYLLAEQLGKPLPT